MRRLLLTLAALALLPFAASGQAPAPALSLDLGSSPGLPRLGVWTGVGDRMRVGLELEADFRSWRRFPGGDSGRAVSGTDWRMAAGPSATFRLARTGGVSLFAYGSASWGGHRFAILDLSRDGGEASRELSLRPGLGLDWAVSERWSVGVLYSGQWLSGSDQAEAFGALWRSPGLGFSLRFGF